MDIFALQAAPRTAVGKSAVDALRTQGLVPAVIYGPQMENVIVSVPAKAFSELTRKASGNPIIELTVGEGAGAAKYKVLIQETVRDPLSQDIDHIDFYRFSATKKVHVDVAVELVGTAPAVADLGGVLLQNLDSVEVECLPDAIPERFAIDIARLASLNDTIYIKDLAMPEGVACHMDPHTPIVSVTEPEKEEEVPAAPAEPAEILTEAEAKRKEEEEKESQEQATQGKS